MSRDSCFKEQAGGGMQFLHCMHRKAFNLCSAESRDGFTHGLGFHVTLLQEPKCCVSKAYVIEMPDGVRKHTLGIMFLAALVFIGLVMFSCDELEF